MKKQINYTDEPLGEVEVVADFLPPPELLVLKEETVKVTIALSKSSVSFFKLVLRTLALGDVHERSDRAGNFSLFIF